MFGWLEPEMIKVNGTLRTNLEDNKGKINAFRFVGNHPNETKVRTIDYYLESTKKQGVRCHYF